MVREKLSPTINSDTNDKNNELTKKQQQLTKKSLISRQADSLIIRVKIFTHKHKINRPDSKKHMSHEKKSVASPPNGESNPLVNIVKRTTPIQNQTYLHSQPSKIVL